MANEDDDIIRTYTNHISPSNNPLVLLEQIINKNYRATEILTRENNDVAVYDAMCISGVETGETKGDGLGLSSVKQVSVSSPNSPEPVTLTKVKFRIVDGAGSKEAVGHTSLLKSPDDPNLTPQQQNAYLHLHPWCYSMSEDIGGLPIKPGDVLQVFKENGCYFYKSTSERGFIAGIGSFLNGALGGFTADASDSFSSSASGGPTSTMANIKVSGQTYTNANAFIKKLKDSGHFYGFSDQFLSGLTANAQAESALGSAKNDSRLDWVVGDKLTSRHSATAQKRAISGWGSHGYWQMNVCPGYAEGSLFAKDKGIDITTEAGKNEFVRQVNDEIILFSWMAMRMRNISEIAPFISATDKNAAFNAGKAITQYFEKPAGCGPGQPCLKSNERGKIAQQMYDNYSDQEGL